LEIDYRNQKFFSFPQPRPANPTRPVDRPNPCRCGPPSATPFSPRFRASGRDPVFPNLGRDRPCPRARASPPTGFPRPASRQPRLSVARPADGPCTPFGAELPSPTPPRPGFHACRHRCRSPCGKRRRSDQSSFGKEASRQRYSRPARLLRLRAHTEPLRATPPVAPSAIGARCGPAPHRVPRHPDRPCLPLRATRLKDGPCLLYAHPLHRPFPRRW
jgi:hypothetical protein